MDVWMAQTREERVDQICRMGDIVLVDRTRDASEGVSLVEGWVGCCAVGRSRPPVSMELELALHVR